MLARMMQVACDAVGSRPRGAVRAGVGNGRHTTAPGTTGGLGRPADLRGLADAVGDCLGGTVIISDARLDIMTYRVDPDRISADAQTWILCRQAPNSVRRHLSHGRLADTWTGRDLLRLGGSRTEAWTVAFVRHDGEILGGIWLIGPVVTAGSRAEAILAEAARRAVGHLGGDEKSAGVDVCEMFGRALQAGGPDLREIGVPALRADRPVHLVVLAGQGRAAGELEERVRLECGPADGMLPVWRSGERVYALAPQGPVLDRLTEIAAADPGGQTRCAISDVVSQSSRLPQVRAALDRLLDVAAGEIEQPVIRMPDHRSLLVIAEIAELAGHSPTLAGGPVLELARLDAARGTGYVATLEAYFGCGKDLQRAARMLQIHRNTLRYRLERIQVLVGLDLADPLAELIADLQLRIRRINDGAGSRGEPRRRPGYPADASAVPA